MGLIAGLVAGCGDQGQDVVVGARQALSQAADNTADTTVKASVTATVELAGGDLATTAAEELRDGDKLSMTIHLPINGMDIALRFVAADGHQFLKYEGMPEGAPVPTDWIELTGAGEATTAVTSSASLEDYLTQFRRKGAKVKDLGVGQNDGIGVHRYSTVADFSKALLSSSSSITNPTMVETLQALATTMSKVPTTIEVDDEHHRIVQISYDTESAGTKVHTVMKLSDYGKPVTIEVPENAKKMSLDEYAAIVFPPADTGG